MHSHLFQKQTKSLYDDKDTVRKLRFNKERNEEQDHTEQIDQAAALFRYEDCKHQYWNPEEYSLLYGTPLWFEATPSQKVILNQLYWVAYYSQIISAEIATIFMNQVSSAGLYTFEDFRLVCDTLDLESKQERAHINAFKTISEEAEWQILGERLFTYPMRSLYDETMLFSANNYAQRFWRKLQLQGYTLLATQNAFIASQYLLIRGIRTLNGKLIQHKLSKHYKEGAPIPTAIHYYHFMDESHHFNSSRIIGNEIPNSLPPPTAFEKWIINRAVIGCQKDHYHFSVAVNGIFWYDPALFPVLYRLFRSKVFNMDDKQARHMLYRCFCEETEGLHQSYGLHRTALESYKSYVDSNKFLIPKNLEMEIMAGNSIEKYLKQNKKAFKYGKI